MAVHPFPPYRPDVCQLDAGVTGHSVGVLPAADCLHPFKDFQAYSGAISTGPALGGFWAKKQDGTNVIIAGTATKLKRLAKSLSSTLGWVDNTPAAGDYAVPTNNFWQFKLFGSTLVAMNGTDPAQTIDINTTSITSSFADLNTSISASIGMKYVDIVGDFLVLANDGVNNTKSNLVKWSQINDASAWDVDVNSAGEQRLPSGGDITGLTGSRISGHVYTEDSIWRMTFTGGDEIFRFDQIESEVGSKYPYALTQLWDVDYFLSSRGFMRLNRDETLTPIGFGQVDNTFFADVSDDGVFKTQLFADPERFLVWCLYFSSSNSTNYADKALVHHVLTEQWRPVSMDHSTLMTYVALGISTDDMGAIYGTDTDEAPAYGTALGNVLTSFDAVPNSTNVNFGGFNSADRLGSFTGDNVAAEIETGEFQLTPGGRAFVQNVHPIIEGTNDMTVRVDKRELIGDSWTAGTDVATETTTGDAHQRVTGRFHKARIKIPAGTAWDGAHGVITPEFIPDGRR